MWEWFQETDRTVVLWLNQFVGRSDLLDRTADGLVSTYLISSMLLVACICYLWFRKAGALRGTERQMIIAEFMGICFAGPVSRVLQLLLRFHPRPFHTPDLHFHVPAIVDPAEFNLWSSFPSDHAALYYALAFMILLHSRALGIAAMVVSSAAVLPRVYLGYHWPSDILGGAVVGVLCVLACRRATPWVVISKVTGWEKNAPYMFYTAAFLICYQIGTLFEETRRLGTGLKQILGHYGL